MINAKVGQKWRCRNGEIREITRVDESVEGKHAPFCSSAPGRDGSHWHRPDGRSLVWKEDRDLISLVDEKEDKKMADLEIRRELSALKERLAAFKVDSENSAKQAAAAYARVETLEKSLTELRKPAPIRHGDYGTCSNGTGRIFMLHNGKIAAFENNLNDPLCVNDANSFQDEYKEYKILGNIFDDMAKKDQA